MIIATNLGAQVFTTVNYGTGTPGEAAAWVLSANKTNHCGFKYWEIGNECYGSWETDSHAIPHDPYTYATNAAAYIQQMKAAYPAVPIKVGIVVVPGREFFEQRDAFCRQSAHRHHELWVDAHRVVPVEKPRGPARFPHLSFLLAIHHLGLEFLLRLSGQ